jgi:CRISPR system Cascade subunit CasA
MTQTAAFNLLDDPWIDVLENDLTRSTVSVLELFRRAHEITTISTELTTQRFALTRVLLAFLHRGYGGPATLDRWQELWGAPSLPMAALESYSARVRDRFNLFDPAQPFFQVADLRTASDEVFGLERLIADVPNGHPFFTTRSGAGLAAISAKEAALWLIHAQGFDPSGIKSGAVGDATVKGGKGYPIGTGWAGQLGGILAEGATLRETLLLNLIPSDQDARVVTNDLPAWERPPQTAARDDRQPSGPVDVFTWQARRIRLVSKDGAVIGVVLSNGDRLDPQNRHLVEPLTSWRYSEPQTKKHGGTVFMPSKHDAERDMWRGVARLLGTTTGSPKTGKNVPQPPRSHLITWLSTLVYDEVISPDRLVVVSRVGITYGSQSAVIEEVIGGQVSLPAIVVAGRPDMLAAVVGGLDDAEKSAWALGRLCGDLVVAAGGDRDGAEDGGRQSVFAALSAPVQRWLASICADSDATDVRRDWQVTVRSLVEPLSLERVRACGPAAWIGRPDDLNWASAAKADADFRGRIRHLLNLAYTDWTPSTEETPS